MTGTRFDAQTSKILGNYSADVLPAVEGQTGYFLQGGTLSAVALSTNTVNWTFTGDGQLTTSPIVVNQYVFIGSSSGNVYGLDTTTSQVAWQANVGAAIPSGSNGGSQTPVSGLSAGDGLLVIPAGATPPADIGRPRRARPNPPGSADRYTCTLCYFSTNLVPSAGT